MIRVVDNNGIEKTIPRYILDTNKTITDRITVQYNSLVEYVHITNTTPNDYTLVDIWRLCRKTPSIDTLLTDAMKQMFDAKTIVFLWCIYHIEQYGYTKTLLQSESNLQSVFFELDILVSKNEVVTHQQELVKRYDEFRDSQIRYESQLREFDAIRPYPVSEQITERNKLSVVFSTASLPTLKDVFNVLNTSWITPVIHCDRFYKVHKGHVPKNWFQSTSERIEIIVVSGDSVDRIGKIFIKQLQTSQFTLSYQQITDVDTSKLIDTLLRPITDIVIENTSTIDIGGYFGIDTIINHIVFADTIMNHPILSEYVSLKDIDITTSKLETTRHVYFEHPQSDDFATFVMSTRKSFIKEPLFKVFGSRLFTNVYVRNANSNASISTFVQIIQRMMTLYHSQYDTIANTYSRLGVRVSGRPVDDSGPEDASHPFIRQQYLRNIVPQVFKPLDENTRDFSRKCQPIRRLPKVLRDDVQVDSKDDGSLSVTIDEKEYPVMVFPKESDTSVDRSFRYVCLDPEYPVPGLIRFPNAFNYAPCCFKVPANGDRTFKKYDQYLRQPPVSRLIDAEGIAPDTSTTVADSKYILITDKFVPHGRYGKFQPDSGIQQLLDKINVSGKEIYRKGVDYSTNSLLACICTAFDYPEMKLSKPERTRFLQRERQRLEPFLDLARQEMYDMDTEGIRQYLLNSEEYLDPLKVLRIVEHVYQCVIVLFVKNPDHPNGELVLPRHTQGYVHLNHPETLPRVYLFNHTGPVDNIPLFPHCELIVYAEKGSNLFSDFYTIWQPQDPVQQSVDTLYTIYSRYEYGTSDVETVYDGFQLPITAQQTDEFGKVRLLEFENEWVIQTTPLPVLPVPHKSLSVTLFTDEQIRRLLQNLQLSDVRTHSVDGVLQYVEGRFDDKCRFTLYSNTYTIGYTNTGSAYIYNKRCVRLLLNTALYLLSIFIHEYPDRSLDAFVQQSFVVRNGYRYDLRVVNSLNWLSTTSSFVQGRRIVCDSEETKRRIVFQLRLMLTRNRTEVLNFRTQTTITGLYKYAYDFDTAPDQIVVHYDYTTTTKKLPDLFAFSQRVPTLVTDLSEVEPETHPTPFFFIDTELTDDKVRLGRVYDTLEDATTRDERITSYYLSVSTTNGYETYVVGDNPSKRHIVATASKRFVYFEQ